MVCSRNYLHQFCFVCFKSSTFEFHLLYSSSLEATFLKSPFLHLVPLSIHPHFFLTSPVLPCGSIRFNWKQSTKSAVFCFIIGRCEWHPMAFMWFLVLLLWRIKSLFKSDLCYPDPSSLSSLYCISISSFHYIKDMGYRKGICKSSTID